MSAYLSTGGYMAKKHNIQKVRTKKQGKPRVRFNFWMLVIIFALSFVGCFGVYMAAANINDNFLDENPKKTVVQSKTTETSTQTASSAGEEGTEPASDGAAPAANTVANPVPESAAADASYFESCCLVTDSTLLKMGSTTGLKDVLGNADLNAASCLTTKISSSYGTLKIYETMKVKKPDILYLMLGSDIGLSPTDAMVQNYTQLVTDLHNDRPDMKIYIMQLPPTAADTETVTNELINTYNSMLLDMANSIGVYCIDTNTALKSADGVLSAEYWSAEESSLTDAAYKAVEGYILTHTA